MDDKHKGIGKLFQQFNQIMAFGKAYISAKKFVDTLAKRGTQIDSAYIFGSYAKGIATTDSDIDICIISPNFSGDLVKERMNLESISRQIDEKIEPHPMSSLDFAEKYNQLAHEIKTTGVQIL